MAEKGVNQNQLAKAVGATRATVSDWYNGKTRVISHQYVFAVAAFFDVTELWLNQEKGPKRYPKTHIEGLAEGFGRQQYVALGLIGEQEDQSVNNNESTLCPINFSEEYLQRNGWQLESLKVFVAPDDSMAPEIRQGDHVIVDTSSKTPMKDNGRYAIYIAGKPKLIRTTILTTGDILIGDGSATTGRPPERITPELEKGLQIIGEVVMRVGKIS